MKDDVRTYFHPDMISYGLFAVVKSTQLALRPSGQEAICGDAGGNGPGQLSCSQ